MPTDPQPRQPGFRACIARDGSVDVALSGDLDTTTKVTLARQLAALGGRLAARADVRPARLVIDVSGVTFLDCASARLLASTAAFLPAGQRPVLLSARPAVRRVLELTGLAEIIELAD